MTARKRAGARRGREAPSGPPAPARGPRLILASIAIAFGLRALASLAPLPAVWGLDMLRIWPRGEVVAILLVGAVGFVPPVARVLEGVMGFAGSLGARRPWVVDLALSIGAGVALFFLRDTVHWVGDHTTRIGQLVLGAPIAKVFPQAAPLDKLVNIVVPRWILGNGQDVTVALHAVGAVVGALFTFVALSFVRAAGATRGPWVAAAALILGGGFMLHFAGYDKFGPLLVGIALAAWGTMRVAHEGRGSWAVGAGLVVCLLSHRSGFALLPAGAWVLGQAWRRAQGRAARIEALAAAALVLAVAAVMLPRALHLLDTIDRVQNLEGPPVSGDSPLARALSAWTTRALDAMNVLFLLTPLWPVGLAVAWLARRDAAEERAAASSDDARFRLGPVALLAIGPEVVLLLVTRGAQGAQRDWDMHVGATMVIALASVAGLIAVWRRHGAAGSLAPILTATIASAIPLWAVHVDAGRQLARIHQLLADRQAWTDGAWARAHDFLGVRALQEQRPMDAIRELEAAASVAPNPRFFFQIGLAHRMLMRFDMARASFEKAHSLDPKLADAWVGFALLAFDEHDYPRVVASAESALFYAPHRRDAKEMRDKAKAAIESGR